MKILHVFISMPVGGAEDLVLSMVRHPSAEFQAEVVCLKELGVAGAEAQREGLPVHLLPLVSSKRLQPLAVLRLARWMKAQRYDVVHSHVYNAHVYAVLAARLAGIPVVMQHHKTFNRERRRRWLILRLLTRWTRAQITLSEQTQVDLIEALKVSPQTCSVVSNVVDDTVFRPAADRAQARQAVGLDAQKAWVGGVASLTPQKNHAATVRMMAELARQGCAAMGVICGEGLKRTELKAEIDRLGIHERLRLVGNQRPIAPWIQAFDVLVLPSSWEGQPMVLLQALACDTPVVASAIEGNVATLGADHPGLFALDDDAAYARLVRACVEDAAFRSAVLEHQRKRRAQQPGFSSYMEQVAAVYRRIMAEKR
jgi:glycosyltransferase involved in cell wall biosynthesis